MVMGTRKCAWRRGCLEGGRLNWGENGEKKGSLKAGKTDVLIEIDGTVVLRAGFCRMGWPEEKKGVIVSYAFK